MGKTVERHAKIGYSILGTMGHGRVWLTFLGWGIALAATGCGYHFQRSDSPYLREQGIQKVYLPPTENLTFKPGVEMLIHNELLKVLSARRTLQVVNSREDADAVLTSVVTAADYSPSGTTNADQLNPTTYDYAKFLPVPTLGSKDNLGNSKFALMGVANYYSGSLTCQFNLQRARPAPGKRDVLWADALGRAKVFPGSNSLDVAGTTSALINDSEFDRVVGELTTQIVADAHDSMVAAF